MTVTVPTIVVTGATGAGKTTYIAQRLRSRPAGERWAVLLNDFGTAQIDAGPDLLLREVAGCICCSARVGLRTGLIALLRQSPARLFVEASAAANPDAIHAVLREPGIAAAVALEATVCVVQATHAVDVRLMQSSTFREQISAADLVVLAASDDSSELRERALRALAALGARRVENGRSRGNVT